MICECDNRSFVDDYKIVLVFSAKKLSWDIAQVRHYS